MILTSTLSNFFSNLINHSLARKTTLKQRSTQRILQVVQVLVREGYLNGYSLSEDQEITVVLKYMNQQPSITRIQQFSKPGKRVYVTNQWLYRHKTPHLYLISTPQGLLTQNQACQSNVGGELICKII